MRRLTPLLLEEQQALDGAFTHVAVLDADDLTMATANTVQDIALGTVPKGWVINKTMVVLRTPFENTADAAYNTTTLIVGDAGSSNRYMTSKELNKNAGGVITYPGYNSTAYQVTADTPIVAEFGSMAAKNLNSLNKGEVHIYFGLIDTGALSELAGNQPIVAK
jgi:hypothetical protein